MEQFRPMRRIRQLLPDDEAVKILRDATAGGLYVETVAILMLSPSVMYMPMARYFSIRRCKDIRLMRSEVILRSLFVS